MERFGYKNLRAVEKEDARILAMLEAESWGDRRDMEEEQEEMQHEMNTKIHQS